MLGIQLQLPAWKLERDGLVFPGFRHLTDLGRDRHRRLNLAFLRGRERRSEVLGEKCVVRTLGRHRHEQERAGRRRRADIVSGGDKRRIEQFMRTYHQRLS